MIWPPGSVGVRAIVNDSAPKRVRSNRSGADSQRWTYSPETPAPGKITGPSPVKCSRRSPTYQANECVVYVDSL